MHVACEFPIVFDGRVLAAQMGQWRGGQHGRGGGARTAKAIERGGGRGISSRPGSGYSFLGQQVCCGDRVVSVWSRVHIGSCVVQSVLFLILLWIFGWAGGVMGGVVRGSSDH